jgi:hypothetical protein
MSGSARRIAKTQAGAREKNCDLVMFFATPPLPIRFFPYGTISFYFRIVMMLRWLISGSQYLPGKPEK